MKTKLTEIFSPGGAITENIDFLKILPQSFNLFESSKTVQFTLTSGVLEMQPLFFSCGLTIFINLILVTLGSFLHDAV